jgi:chitin synthase
MLYNENIYFAEDRILCMEIHKNGLDLVYLPDALAEVDPIKTVHGLMGQRKRWINGSYFAFEKVKKEIGQTNQCDLVLRIQVLFYDFLNLLVYFAPAIFFFTIHISMKAFRTDVLDQILQPIQSSA